MKKSIAIFVLVLMMSFGYTAQAQSFGYVDTEYVLEQVPDYQKAQEQLDKVVSGWRQEIEQMHKEVDEMYRQFQAEQVLLTESERIKREDAIVAKERDMRAYQKQRFGPEGDLLKKRQELVQPIQNEVYAAIERLAKKRKVDFILDKSGGVSILYANPQYDLTNDVLKELNIK